MKPEDFQGSFQGTLLRLGRRMKAAALLRGAAAGLAVLPSVWLAAFLADNLLRLPGPLRLPLALAALGVSLWSAWRHLLRTLFRAVRPERVACELERRCGRDDNLLINACQLERAALPFWSAGILRSAQAQTAALASETVWQPRALRRVGLAAAGAGLAWLLYATFWPAHVANAWMRLSRPLAETPPLGRVRIETTPARDVACFEGESLRIEARILGGAEDEPPPVLRRAQAGRRFRNASEAPMDVGAEPGRYTATLCDLREPFEFCVAAGGTWSPSVRVRVRRLPRPRSSLFLVTPPAYLVRAQERRPGPPQALAGPRGSAARLRIRFDAPVAEAFWTAGGAEQALTHEDGEWTGETLLEQDGDYQVCVVLPESERRFKVGGGPLFAKPDPAPAVELAGVDVSALVWPGESLPLEPVAADDGGLQELRIERRDLSAGPDAPRDILRHWRYEGPPGRRGETRERWTLTVDPERFPPGSAHVLQACARDFNPEGTVARSRPVVLRIRDPRQAGGTDGSPAEDALTRAVEAQRQALGLTRALILHLDEALAQASLGRHAAGMTARQADARRHGETAAAVLRSAGRTTDALRLDFLTRGEMGWALETLAALESLPASALPGRLDALAERQLFLLHELLALLGRLRALPARPEGGGTRPEPAATLRDAAPQLQQTLRDFAAAQKRILRETLPLAARGPDDLTGEEEDILGRLAREEARQAAFLKDAVDDFSKLPLQDFADGSLASQFHTVYQEVEKAAAELYAKKIELAVPLEQSGLEMAEELLHNLEKWLPDTPDTIQWLMEEPPDMPLPPLAELPMELEDIVGELLDEEAAMTEDIEDVTSSWIGSFDKGVGWDAMDGPISDMSAKAVTGNRLPNQMEIGGRAGEGRSGRSHGQMVESEAAGRGGRQTPTRVTPSPFESGSVADRSEEDPGGSTGGGKLSGFAGQGLRGPAPAPRLEKMARLAGRQAEIRQNAERLQLHLRAWNAPGGDLNQAVAAMRAVETAARSDEGVVLRQAHAEALGAMRQTRDALAAEAQVRRERAPLVRERAEALWMLLREQLPPGYEEMAAAYFLRLAEEERHRGGGAPQRGLIQP